jgi:hypothetical protein
VTEIRGGVCDAVEEVGFVSREDGSGWASLYFGFGFGHGDVGDGNEVGVKGWKWL